MIFRPEYERKNKRHSDRYAFLNKYMNDIQIQQCLRIIRLYVRRLPAGYVKEQFAEDIGQELFYNCLRLFGRCKNTKYPLSTLVHNYVKKAAFRFWRSYQKIYEHELFGNLPPPPRRVWAENAAIPLNFTVETWFDLQDYVRKNMTAEEKTLLRQKYKGRIHYSALPCAEESKKTLARLYRKLRGDFCRKER